MPDSPANLLIPPSPDDYISFAPEFGRRTLLTVDTEEEFDWDGDFDAFSYGLESVPKLQRFQQFAEGLGVVPLYLVDWPLARSEIAREVLRPAVAAGRAEIGIQLHPWVNPPHLERTDERNSFAGNLPPALEREKFERLRDAIEVGFAVSPVIYRAGRYGVGANTAQLLEENAIAIDTSVRAFYDYSDLGGPDYSRHPHRPYRVSDRLVELPLTSVFTGRLRKLGPSLYPSCRRFPLICSALAKTGLLERISLTPEGIDTQAARRAVDQGVADGLPLFVLSFHSPSLAPGHTPYVRSKEDVDALYDWFRAVYARFADHGIKPTTTTEILAHIEN